MRKFFFFLFWVAVFVAAIYQARDSKVISKATGRFLSLFSPQQRAVSHFLKATTTPNPVTLYLKNGSVISGELLLEDDRQVTLRWQ